MSRWFEEIKRHLTYANVVVTLLLFVALGGTAWALAANSVGSRQIKPRAVKSSDIAANAVSGSKVADGSLAAADLAPGAAGVVAIRGGAEVGSPTPVEILSSRGFELSFACDTIGSNAFIDLLAAGPGGTQLNFSGARRMDGGSPEPFISGLNLNSAPQVVATAIDGGSDANFTYVHGVFRSPTSTVSFDVAISALQEDFDDPSCRAQGQAVPTP